MPNGQKDNEPKAKALGLQSDNEPKAEAFGLQSDNEPKAKAKALDSSQTMNLKLKLWTPATDNTISDFPPWDNLSDNHCNHRH